MARGECHGRRVVRANVRQSLADDLWHEVSILRPTLSQHILRVDDTARFDNLPGAGEFLLGGDNGWTRLFIGGLPESMYDALPRQIRSRRGYYGCMASVDIDGDKRSLLVAGERPTEFFDDIVAGCQGRLCNVNWSSHSSVKFSSSTCYLSSIIFALVHCVREKKRPVAFLL